MGMYLFGNSTNVTLMDDSSIFHQKIELMFLGSKEWTFNEHICILFEDYIS